MTFDEMTKYVGENEIWIYPTAIFILQTIRRLWPTKRTEGVVTLAGRLLDAAFDKAHVPNKLKTPVGVVEANPEKK